MLIIPYKQLQKDTLDALLEEYATRDGTDYGVKEVSTAYKVNQLHHQLEQGDIVITYDATTESCTLVSAEQARELDQQDE